MTSCSSLKVFSSRQSRHVITYAVFFVFVCCCSARAVVVLQNDSRMPCNWYTSHNCIAAAAKCISAAAPTRLRTTPAHDQIKPERMVEQHLKSSSEGTHTHTVCAVGVGLGWELFEYKINGSKQNAAFVIVTKRMLIGYTGYFEAHLHPHVHHGDFE